MFWSVVEATFPMLPVEFILIPLTRLQPKSAGRLALLATVFSALGVVYSYALGYFAERVWLWNGVRVTHPWLQYLVDGLDTWGEGFVFLATLLPVPLFAVGLGSGFLHIGMVPFIITVTLGRALRFYLVTRYITHRQHGKQYAGPGRQG